MKKGLIKRISGLLAAAVLTVSAVSPLSAQPNMTPDWSTLSSWAESDIKEAYDLELLQVYYARDFQSEFTREQFCEVCATVLAKWYDCNFIDLPEVEELKEIADKSNFEGFSDTSAWFVEFCAKLGIISGMGDGTFAPDSSITREQAAKMLYNTLDAGTDIISDAKADNEYGVNGIFIPHIFADGSEIDSWARYEIYTVYNLGIMTGDTQNNFDPLGTYTREQAYATFLRLYKAYTSPDELNAPTPEAFPEAYNHLYRDSDGSYYLDANSGWNNKEYEPLYYDGFGGVHKASDEGYGYVYPFDQEYMRVIVIAWQEAYEHIYIDKYKNEYSSIEKKEKEVSSENEYTVEYASDEQDGNFIIIDSNGNTVKEFYLDPDTYKVIYINGTNMILGNPGDSEHMFLYRAYSSIFVDRDYTGMYFDRDGYIIAYKTLRWDESEFDCHFLDRSGNIIHDLGSLGYKGLVANIFEYNYTYAQCLFLLKENSNESADGLNHYEVMTMDGRIIGQDITKVGNNTLISSDDGIFAYKAENNKICFFDNKGNNLGTVTTDGDIITGGIKFISGLLNVHTKNGYFYYTPFGEEALKKAWTVKE